VSLEKFHFDGVDGKDYELPKQIPGGALRKARKLSALDAAFTVFENTADEATIAAWDLLPTTVGMKILNDWFQGVSAPNSPSSSS